MAPNHSDIATGPACARSSEEPAGLTEAELANLSCFASSLPGEWQAERFRDEHGTHGMMLLPLQSPDTSILFFRAGGFVQLGVLLSDDYSMIACALHVEALFSAAAGQAMLHGPVAGLLVDSELRMVTD